MVTINSTKFKIQKKGALIGGFLLLVVLVGTGIFLSSQKNYRQPHLDLQKQVVGAVLPHHLLVKNFIDEFYQILAKKIQPERVILISPNHFNYGVRYIQTATQTPAGEYDALLDQDEIKVLAQAGAVSIENKYYSKEHGIFVHYPFIKKYFPEAKIMPLILKVGTPQVKLERLVAALVKLEPKRTLILASVDFTHYVGDEIALPNDQRTIAYFEKWSRDSLSLDLPTWRLNDFKKLAKTAKQNDPEAVAIDSPETLAVLLNYLNQELVSGFKLWKRSSTQSFIHVTDPDSNTSHIFGVFE